MIDYFITIERIQRSLRFFELFQFPPSYLVNQVLAGFSASPTSQQLHEMEKTEDYQLKESNKIISRKRSDRLYCLDTI
jgi:hypothetical protein